MILASATDISTGSRFVFSQGIFDVICSDLNAVRAVPRRRPRRRPCRSCSRPSRSTTTAARANGPFPPGRSCSSTTDNPPRPAARAIRSLNAQAGVRRQRQPALPPSRRRRRLRQRRHARRARCAGNPRSVARGRRAVAARRRAQDRRFRRQLAVFAADQLGQVGIAPGHRRHPAQVGGHSDRRVLLRGGRAPEGHGRALEDDAHASAIRRPLRRTRIRRWPKRCASRTPKSTRSTCRSPHSRTRRSSTT